VTEHAPARDVPAGRDGLGLEHPAHHEPERWCLSRGPSNSDPVWVRRRGDGWEALDAESGWGVWHAFGDFAVVLDDPATLGALLALVREKHGEPTIHLVPTTRDRYDSGEPYIVWHVERLAEGETEWLRESGAWGALEDGHRDPPITGLTEAEALVAALEAPRG
jgi:hypothetical protein